MKIFSAVADAFGAALAGVGEAFERAAEARRARLRAAARELGLEVDKRGHFVGRWDGVPVHRYSVDRGGKDSTDWWCVTEFGLQVPVPGFLTVRPRNLLDHLGELFGGSDLALGLPIDDRIQVSVKQDQQDSARALLAHPQVADRLEALVRSDLRWKLTRRTLTLSFRGRHQRAGPRGLDLGASTVHALERLTLPPWRALGRDLGHGQVDLEHIRLSGHLDGIPMRVEVRHDRGRTVTWIVAWFDPHLPADTRVQHLDRLPKGQQVGDAILDPMLRCETSDAEALRARLARDAVRPPLLEVLHGFSGSTLYEDRVALRIAGHASVQLPARVALVQELVRGLQAP